MAIKEFLAAMTLKTKIIAVSAAVLVVGTVGTIIGISVAKEDEYRVVKVFEMTGEAIVERNGTGELSAYVGMNLENGDKLTVGEESTLRIVMDNDKYILLDGGTVLKLNATGTASNSRTKIELMRGEILNEITKPLSSNSSYEVATPKATMAVRGTSFVVKVEEDDNGGYITNQQTLQGKVEVELLSPEGKKTGKKVIIEPDKSVTIKTVPNEESGEDAEIDGTSFFVIENADGDFEIVSDPEEAVSEIDYEEMSDNIKQVAIYSDDTRVMVLDEVVAEKIRETLSIEPEVTTTTVEEPETPEETTTPLETTIPEVTTVPEETTLPEVTTVTEMLTLPEETTTEVTTTPEVTTVPEETTTPEETKAPSSTTAPETTTTEEITTTLPEEIIEYDVEFVYNGNVYKTVKVKAGETISPSESPSVSDLGYDPEDNCVVWRIDGTLFESSYTVTEDLTIVADLGTITTVIFKGLNGEELGTAKVCPHDTLNSSGATIPEITNIPEGFTAKYFYNNVAIDPENDYYNGASTHTYTAELCVTIKFLDGDDNELASYEIQQYKSISSVNGTIPAIPNIDGYSTAGWTDGVSTYGTIKTTDTFSSSKTFRPKYDRLYSIRYSMETSGYLFSSNANFLDVQRTYNAYIQEQTVYNTDGTEATDVTVTYSVNGNTIADPNNTMVGELLTLAGVSDDYTGIIQIDVNVTENVTITFLGETDQEIGSYNIPSGSKLTTTPTVESRAGYETCWYNGSNKINVATATFTEDTTLKLQYEEITYIILYTAPDGYYMTSDGYPEIVSQGTYNNGVLVDYTTVYVSDGMNVTPDNTKKYQYSINGHDLSDTAPISEVVTYAGDSITSDYWIYLTLTVVTA